MKRLGRFLWRTRAGNRWLFGGLLLGPAVLAVPAILCGWEPAKGRHGCLLLRATGWRCPSCGGTRMAAALLRGDVKSAWYYHPLFLLVFAALAVGLAFGFFRTFWKSWRPPVIRGKSGWWLLIPIVWTAFFFLRNTGWYQSLWY